MQTPHRRRNWIRDVVEQRRGGDRARSLLIMWPGNLHPPLMTALDRLFHPSDRRRRSRALYLIDETASSRGSCWTRWVVWHAYSPNITPAKVRCIGQPPGGRPVTPARLLTCMEVNSTALHLRQGARLATSTPLETRTALPDGRPWGHTMTSVDQSVLDWAYDCRRTSHETVIYEAHVSNRSNRLNSGALTLHLAHLAIIDHRASTYCR